MKYQNNLIQNSNQTHSSPLFAAATWAIMVAKVGELRCIERFNK